MPATASFDAARRTARRLRRLLAGVAALLVVALVAGGLAFAAQRRANREQNAAAHQALVSNSMALRGNKRELAALLAVEAHRLAPSAATESALFGTFTAAPALERTVRSEVLEGGGEAGRHPDRRRDDGGLRAVGDRPYRGPRHGCRAVQPAVGRRRRRLHGLALQHARRPPLESRRPHSTCCNWGTLPRDAKREESSARLRCNVCLPAGTPVGAPTGSSTQLRKSSSSAEAQLAFLLYRSHRRPASGASVPHLPRRADRLCTRESATSFVNIQGFLALSKSRD